MVTSLTTCLFFSSTLDLSSSFEIPDIVLLCAKSKETKSPLAQRSEQSQSLRFVDLERLLASTSAAKSWDHLAFQIKFSDQKIQT
jgi:hypothetical protein